MLTNQLAEPPHFRVPPIKVNKDKFLVLNKYKFLTLTLWARKLEKYAKLHVHFGAVPTAKAETFSRSREPLHHLKLSYPFSKVRQLIQLRCFQDTTYLIQSYPHKRVRFQYRKFSSLDLLLPTSLYGSLG